VENLHLHSVLSPTQLQEATKGSPLEVAELSVRTLRFKLPDLSRWTLEVTVDGLSVSLKQKSMPPVRPLAILLFPSCSLLRRDCAAK